MGTPQNSVGRSWTLVGNLDHHERVAVDRRGLVAVEPGSWSLDWWIRGDRWLYPAHEPGVRQRLVSETPVVETVVRAGGGDIVHRCYCALTDRQYLVIEIENATETPVAIAMAPRPYDLTGPGRISSIERCDLGVIVDGRVGFAANRAPGEFAVGVGGTDAAHLLTSDSPTTGGGTVGHCPAGMANAAAVYPLVHGTTLRIVVPLDRTDECPSGDEIDAIPSGERVSRGWRSVTENAVRVVLPAGRLADGLDAARRHLLVHHEGDRVNAAPMGAPGARGADEAVLSALTALGHRDEVRQVLIERAKGQDPRGLVSERDTDVTGPSLASAGRAMELSPDPAIAEALSEFAADAAHWLAGQPDADAWTRPGLEGAAAVLSAGGHDGPVAEIQRALGAGDAIEPGERDALALGLAGFVSQVPRSLAPWADAEGPVHRVEGPVGLDPVLTAALALASGDLDRQASVLEWLCETASPTWTWPTLLHPKLGTGTGGVGQDGRVAAAVVMLAMSLLVDASGTAGAPEIAVARHWYPAWLGQGVEVHNAPSRHGEVSWAIRWHGERPALLWEIEHRGSASVAPMVTAPGLDPEFVGRTWSGETLLAAPAMTVEPETDQPSTIDLDTPTDISGPIGGGSFT